jgi:hypothetical protein
MMRFATNAGRLRLPGLLVLGGSELLEERLRPGRRRR